MHEESERRAQAVRPLLARLLGAEPGRLAHQPYGHGNLVFALPDHGLVAKTSTDLTAFEHTASNLRILRALGIPVSEIVAFGNDGTHAALVLEWVPGRDLGFVLASLTTFQKRSVAQSVVNIQSRVGALPLGGGFGWTPIGVPGPFPSWLAVVDREHARLPADLRARIDLAPWRRVLREVPPIPFLDDLTVKNAIVDQGRLRGIVDIESIGYGDPLFALALAETTAVLDCDDADYARILRRAWAPVASAERRADLYGALFAAGFLARSPSERIGLFFERRLSRTRRVPFPR